MFARGSAGAAGRSRHRVPGGFPHPRAEFRAGSRPGGFRRRMPALLPRPGSSENTDRRSAEPVPRRGGLFPVPSPAAGRPSRKSGIAPAPRVHNNRGPRRPRLSDRAHRPLRQVCGPKQNPPGGCRPRPAWLAGKAAGSGSLANSSSQPTPGAAGSVGLARRAQAAAPCRARAPQPGLGSSRRTEYPLFSSLQ